MPYTIFNPLWFFDYFVWNAFAYCEAYSIVYPGEGTIAAYQLDLAAVARRQGDGMVRPVYSQHPTACVIYAEKGEASTWDRVPIQHGYRSEADWERYVAVVEGYMARARSPVVVGNQGSHDEAVPPGWTRR